MRTPLRLALLISGGGTTMAAILKACKDGGTLYGLIEPALVIASTPEAGGIIKAVEAKMPTQDIVVIDPKVEPIRDLLETFGRMILSHCFHRGVDVIGQYGWMPKTPPVVMAAYPGMMINQHCGPLDPGRPDFGGPGMYGRRVHSAVLYFARSIRRPFPFTEAVAQRVAPTFDTGAVLHRETVPIERDDDVIALQQRVLAVEHRVQIEVLRQFATGQVFELSRSEPLIFPSEEPVLQEAKRVAKTQFPNG